MAIKNSSTAGRTGTPIASDPGKPLVAAILMLALTAAFGLRAVLSLDALAPAVATLFFIFAAATGGVAMLLRHRARQQARILDIAGVLAFVGVVVSITIESDQMMRLMMLSEQPD